MIKRVLLLAAVILSMGALSAQVKFHTGDDTASLYSKAKSSDKLVFVDLYADWCPPCKAMESNVFSREDVGVFMDKYFVSAKYNIDYQVGKDLAGKYNVRSIPTFLIFNANGELVNRLVGGMSPEDLKANLLKIIQ